MLNERRVHTTLPAADLDRARRFYEGTLGFTAPTITPGGTLYDAGEGTRFLVYQSRGRASGAHTQMGFTVMDIDAEVAALKVRGVTFETYDLPGFDPQTSIAQTGPNRAAWFHDSEGNLLGIVQLGAVAD